MAFQKGNASAVGVQLALWYIFDGLPVSGHPQAASDAIGQITVTKRDHQGVSLDGAIFRIDIQFANGERGGDSAFEVYNGRPLFPMYN